MKKKLVFAATAIIILVSVMALKTRGLIPDTDKSIIELVENYILEKRLYDQMYDQVTLLALLKEYRPEAYRIEIEKIEQGNAGKSAEKMARLAEIRAQIEAEIAAKKTEEYAKNCLSKSVKSAAYIEAQSWVTIYLKAPSTVTYPHADKIAVESFGKCSFKIRGYLDSQNGYGAMIRTNYVAKIQRLYTLWLFDDVAFN